SVVSTRRPSMFRSISWRSARSAASLAASAATPWMSLARWRSCALWSTRPAKSGARRNGLLRLDAGAGDHVDPLVALAREESADLGRRAGAHLGTELAERGHDLGRLHRLVDRSVEPTRSFARTRARSAMTWSANSCRR